MIRSMSASMMLVVGLGAAEVVAQEPASNLLFTREAWLALEGGGSLAVSLPNFLPPEALGRGSVVRLSEGERVVSGWTAINFLSAVEPRTRMYEHILRNLFLRSDETEQAMVARRVEELGVASALAGTASSVAGVLRDVQAIEGVGRPTHLPGALSAVATVLEVDQGITEGELRALVLYAGFIAGAAARIEAFQQMQRRSAWQDPALAAAVANVRRELDRLLEEEIETLRAEYRTRGGMEAAARSGVETFAGLVMGHGTAAVLAGGAGAALGAALPAAFFFALSRQHDLTEVKGVLALGATLREKLFRPDLREAGGRSPEEFVLLLEMHDELLVTLRDTAIQFAGDRAPPEGERPVGGLLDPNSGWPTEGLSGRQYRERAQLFYRGVRVPDPRRARLYDQEEWVSLPSAGERRLAPICQELDELLEALEMDPMELRLAHRSLEPSTMSPAMRFRTENQDRIDGGGGSLGSEWLIAHWVDLQLSVLNDPPPEGPDSVYEAFEMVLDSLSQEADRYIEREGFGGTMVYALRSGVITGGLHESVASLARSLSSQCGATGAEGRGPSSLLPSPESVVRAFFEAVGRGQVEGVSEFLHPQLDSAADLMTEVPLFHQSGRVRLLGVVETWSESPVTAHLWVEQRISGPMGGSRVGGATPRSSFVNGWVSDPNWFGGWQVRLEAHEGRWKIRHIHLARAGPTCLRCAPEQ